MGVVTWLALSLAIGSAAQSSPAGGELENGTGTVLLELFTSEGCSSNPSLNVGRSS